MHSKIITYSVTLLTLMLASGCVRVPAKTKKPDQPEQKQVILVDNSAPITTIYPTNQA